MRTGPPPPLLLVFAPGVAPSAPGPSDGCLGSGRWVPLRYTDSDPIRDFAACDPAAPLRELGIAVDQASLLLRPSFRSDEQAVAQLGRRPTGPAPATILVLSDLARTAGRHGLNGRPHELAALLHLELVQRAQTLLRAGEFPETWYVALGAMQPTVRTFDLVRALRRRLAFPLRRQITAEVTPHGARLGCASARAQDLLASLLAREPFRAYGRVLAAGAGRLDFLPHARVALGDRPCRSRRPRSDEAPAGVFLPAAPRSAEELDVRGLAARFCMRAAQWPSPAPQAPRGRTAVAAAALPGLLPLLGAEDAAVTAVAAAPVR